MPYTFSDRMAQEIEDILRTLSNRGEYRLSRDLFIQEVQQENLRQGRNPDGSPKNDPDRQVPPVVDEAVKTVVHGQTRNERRLARKANGKAPAPGADPARAEPKTHPPQ